MKKTSQDFIILMADDDPDEYFLIKAVMQEDDLKGRLHQVMDGEELMDYLHGRGTYAHLLPSDQLPAIIFLDLNMPKKDGKETLCEIMEHPEFRKIPIVVFTTSRDREDIRYCNENGASLFISKPDSFEKLRQIIKKIWNRWLTPAEEMKTVGELPS